MTEVHSAVYEDKKAWFAVFSGSPGYLPGEVRDNLAFLYKGRLIFAESQETLRKRYGFLKASDETLELVPRSAWCGIRRTENGGCLLLERAALPKELAAELPVEAPALTTIMEYLTKEAVKR